MKRNEELARVSRQAARIIEEQGGNLGLTLSEIADITLRILNKTTHLVAHIRDVEPRRNPMRVAYLAIVDWKKDAAKWYTPFANHRRQTIQNKFADNWSRMEPYDTAAHAINPLAARLADANS